MKNKTTIYIISILMIIVSLFNLTLDIEQKGHYFGNGIICGIGATLLILEFLKSRNTSK
ncbi:MAG TPA: hypothetical protein PKX92_08700 [Edaphocola sp.]|nr:hypothetical protein [Edaphocola sp.]